MGTGQALSVKVTSFEPFESHKGVPRLMTLQETRVVHLVPETVFTQALTPKERT